MKFIDTENFKFPEAEEKVLEYWREIDAFGRILRLREEAGAEEFVFYEGPPTANGKPGIHHVLARAFKDVVCRYKTMCGYYVPRKAGWDTHGLPVEIEVEKNLGLNTKSEIEDYGIAKFNKKCKESVWKYKDEWEKLTERTAFWLDMDDPYITYQTPYIETLWWIIKQFHKKDLLYKGHKVVPWCTRCGSSLSSHEMAQGYNVVKDRSVFVKFELKRGQKIGDWEVPENTFVLSWTTTPWTLPGNVALAVGEDIEYVRLKKQSEENQQEIWIYAKDRHQQLHEITDRFDGSIGGENILGKDLLGLEYEPLFEIKELQGDKSYKVYPADFVTTEDGTGVVHTAVMYGEDDYRLGDEIGLPKFHTVDENGKFIPSVPNVAAMYARANKTTNAIFDHLKSSGYFLAEEKYEHEYPHCWRCDTALLYYAQDSWFVAMSRLRDKLLANNKDINWVPAHIKDGRFGEWIRDVKDWNFSRARYWGTPLPIWECDSCDAREIIGGRDELARRMGAAKNTYYAMRHGEAISNLDNVAAPKGTKFTLTTLGQDQVKQRMDDLRDMDIHFIVASPVERTKETAELVAGELGVEVRYDDRLREIDVGIFEGEEVNTYHNYYDSHLEKFIKRPPEGESLTDLRARVMRVMKELEEENKDKNILLVSHEYPIWMIYGGSFGLSNEETVALRTGEREDDFLRTAEVIEIPYKHLPRDDYGAVNLHRPYVDHATFVCSKCNNGTMSRIEDLADVWFDSGAMPFAQFHFPFEGGVEQDSERRDLPYPADYICEAVDQTRGWFYTLLAVATALGKEAPYGNVISLGHILDKNGQKMSKSRGNAVDPWQMIDTYGSDALRWHFYTVNAPGEPTKFDEADLKTTLRRFFLTTFNVYKFYETYADRSVENQPGDEHVLDKWILARLHETIRDVTEYLDAYDIGRAARHIEEFVDDISKWYLRRSRRRLQKPESQKDYRDASATLRHILEQSALLMAPFAPFFAEALYREFDRADEDGEVLSIHARLWPDIDKNLIDENLIENMKDIRDFATEALNKRSQEGLKVRQPLNTLRVKSKKLEQEKELLDVLAEEVNVKEAICDATIEEEVELDTEITSELKEEGMLRDLIRFTQRLRRDAGYDPEDDIEVYIDAGESPISDIVEANREAYKQEVGAKHVEHMIKEKYEAKKDFSIDGHGVVMAVKKI